MYVATMYIYVLYSSHIAKIEHSHMYIRTYVTICMHVLLTTFKVAKLYCTQVDDAYRNT